MVKTPLKQYKCILKLWIKFETNSIYIIKNGSLQNGNKADPKLGMGVYLYPVKNVFIWSYNLMRHNKGRVTTWACWLGW